MVDLTKQRDFQSLGIMSSVNESYVLLKFGIGIHRDNFGRRAKCELVVKSSAYACVGKTNFI